MTVTEDRPAAGIRDDRSAELGGWLVAHRLEMERRELAWLEGLAEFDLGHGWLSDGQLSCIDWLMWRARMGRATAYEKLPIAHELRRRPAIRDAFADGRLSYSAVRVITRLERPDPDVDAALIDVAAVGSIVDVERVVRSYQLYQDQDRPPPDPNLRRGLRIRAGLDGTSTVEIVLETSEAEELATAIQAFIDLEAVDDTAAGDEAGEPVDESPAGDYWRDPVDESPAGDIAAPIDEPSWPARRADAFVDLVRSGLAHAHDGPAGGSDRYLVHLVVRADGTQLLDGTALDPSVAERVTCDCSVVAHLVGGGGEPLYLGRKTRQWTTAQRRAARVRDGGHCRFPGCHRRYADLHHQIPWDHGGPTDIDRGITTCPRHHTMLHRGYRVTGDANHALTFHRPNGTIIGTTTPRPFSGAIR